LHQACSAYVHVAHYLRLLKDRERENKGSGGGTNWCDFMSVLSRLATAESVYFSLGFMERPGGLGRFVRKEVRVVRHMDQLTVACLARCVTSIITFGIILHAI
jgi:hypothetical protein